MILVRSVWLKINTPKIRASDSLIPVSGKQ